MTGITDRLRELRARIDTVARAAGRDPAGIRLLAVSKGQPVAAIRAAMAAGLGEFGENYLQEALPKIRALGTGARWHFIGRLQSNKTRPVAELFDCVQTLTSARHAERLNAQRPWHAPPLDVLIQLRPAGATAPGVGDRPGVEESGMAALADTVAGLPRLRLRGLMLVPLPGLDAAALAGEYARAARAQDRLAASGHTLDTLSLGMSADLEAAVQAGSTLLRIGTALFGPRPAPAQTPEKGQDDHAG